MEAFSRQIYGSTFSEVHTSTHMRDICPPHSHCWSVNLIVGATTFHLAIKPSGSTVIQLAHVSLKSCVMLAEKMANKQNLTRIRVHWRLLKPCPLSKWSGNPLNVKMIDVQEIKANLVLNSISYEARALCLWFPFFLPYRKVVKWLAPAEVLIC